MASSLLMPVFSPNGAALSNVWAPTCSAGSLAVSEGRLHSQPLGPHIHARKTSIKLAEKAFIRSCASHRPQAPQTPLARITRTLVYANIVASAARSESIMEADGMGEMRTDSN